jgi:hypothetical protein
MIICAEAFYSCKCDEPPMHGGPHLCRCGGSWLDDEILAYPQEGLTLTELLQWPGRFREEDSAKS